MASIAGGAPAFTGAERLGRLALWVLGGVAAAFAVVNFRYIDMYPHPERFPAGITYYREGVSGALFAVHFVGGSLGVLLGVRLLLSRTPFEPRPLLTRAYLALSALGGLFGYYHPLTKSPVDVSSYMMIALQTLQYTAVYHAWGALRERDTSEHRWWMTLHFSFLVAAAIWRLIFGVLARNELDEVFSPARSTPLSESRHYHSAWFLAICAGFAIFTVLRRLAPRRDEARAPALDLEGAFGRR
jgi:hypothetical protein